MQKNIFLDSEGDAWFVRNKEKFDNINYELDPIVRALSIIHVSKSFGDRKVLEIGCSNGHRLAWLKEKFDLDCYGVDPSGKAISEAKIKGLKAEIGTADCLKYEKNYFDIIIFGFCLYLCDREHLFRIACEADRVLKKQGWLIIHDFFIDNDAQCDYHHRTGVTSYKMDYRKLFDWHPSYNCFEHKVLKHNDFLSTDDKTKWVATSVMRKY